MEYRFCAYCNAHHQKTSEFWVEVSPAKVECRLLYSANLKIKLMDKQNNFIKSKYAYGKRQAKTRNLFWDISFERYAKLIGKGCSYCRASLTEIKGVSLDRLDNSLGYLSNNVVPCCPKCNYIRGDNLSPHEMSAAMATVQNKRNMKKTTTVTLVQNDGSVKNLSPEEAKKLGITSKV